MTEYRQLQTTAEETHVNLHHVGSRGYCEPRKEVELILGNLPMKESPIFFKECLSHS